MPPFPTNRQTCDQAIQTLPEKNDTHLVLQIREQSPDLRGEVDDVRGLELVEYRVGLRPVPEVAVLRREEDPRLAGQGVGVGVGLDGLADQARPVCLVVRWRSSFRWVVGGILCSNTPVCRCVCVVREEEERCVVRFRKIQARRALESTYPPVTMMTFFELPSESCFVMVAAGWGEGGRRQRFPMKVARKVVVVRPRLVIRCSLPSSLLPS